MINSFHVPDNVFLRQNLVYLETVNIGISTARIGIHTVNLTPYMKIEVCEP